MPKVSAWCCPHTSKLFALKDEAKYRKHLAKLARKRAESRKENREDAEHDAFLAEAKATLDTPLKISNWIIANMERLHRYHKSRNWMDSDSKYAPLKSIVFEVEYQPMSSNTHGAPKGKPRNHQCESHLPRGYPALHGKLDYTYVNTSGNYNSATTNILEAIGINTGTGGGGNTNRRYGVTIWLDDWPALKENVEQQMLVGVLNGTVTPPKVLNFARDKRNDTQLVWNDEHVTG